jgi:hypothetical protein
MSVASLGLVKNGLDNPLVSISPQEVNAGGNVFASEQLRVQQGFATQDGVVNPTAITFYDFYTASVAGGGLNPHSLQLYGYYDPKVAGVDTIQEHMEVKIVPTALPVLGVPPSTTSVVQTNQSRPFNWAAPFIGTTTGTGVAEVVPCAGIPAGAVIRFYLVGGDIASFAAGIAAPSAVSVQAYTSFTYTGTLGAIYGYEVLFG